MRQYYQDHKAEYAEYCRQQRARYFLFKTWDNMKQRCFNPNHKYYRNYGGRGISVCDEWLSVKPFEDWCLANGWQKGLTIDRIDNDNDYCPDNCHFITRAENTKKRWVS